MNKLFALAGGVLLMTSCVSSKVYKDLESKYNDLKTEHDSLTVAKHDLESLKNTLANDLSSLQWKHTDLQEELNLLKQEKAALEKNLIALKESYDDLEKKSSSNLAANAKKNRELLEKLETESDRLNKLSAELDARSKRINELEAIIAAKDAAMKKLKESLSSALLDFEGKGLTIEQRNGKVYVSMENKLLFSSGSWSVGTEGKKAVMQLGEVLSENQDVAVLIEGHTDNVPYSTSGAISGNWDLSMKRATAIVKLLLENPFIDPANITAAGRSEYAPIASNDTSEGKAKNRRIEVILEPKLDKVSELLSTEEQ